MIMDYSCIEHFDVIQLVQQYGTPLYLYDVNKIEANYKKISASILYRPTELHYPTMCNNNFEMLKFILKLGAHIQTNSVQGYLIAKKAGWTTDKISITTTNISNADMEFYLKEGVLVNFDSIEEVERFGKMVQQTGKQEVKIGIRIFTSICLSGRQITNRPYTRKSRVGIRREQFDTVKQIAAKRQLKIVGVHGYLASNMLQLQPFQQLNSYLMECAKQFPDLEYINVGGGFGLPAKPVDQPFDWKSYGAKLSEQMAVVSKYFDRSIHLKLEPGRSLVGNAGILLTTVTNIKDMGDWTQVGVNCSFGEFARPFIYGMNEGGYHPIMVVNRLDQAANKKYTICGNSVLQGDFLAEDRLLPTVEVGDIIAILNVGAYGASMMSLFPERKRPKEIFVHCKQKPRGK
jgi:diaminopimelate decarboxylase